MLDNLITFSASKEFIRNNQDNLPIPAKTNIPEWYKKLTHSYENQTVKGCMPFLDTLTTGYLLKIATDYKIKHNVEINGEKKAGFDSAQQMMNSLAERININYQGKPEFHGTDQLAGSPLVSKNKNLAFHKILNPWIITTPPGYSTLFVPPLNNTDTRFSIIAERGTPYVQCIPFKRENWIMKIKPKSDKKYLEDRFFMIKHIVHNYKKIFWKKKSWK